MTCSRLLVLTAVACALGAVTAPAAFAANEIVYRCDLDICLLDPANPSAVTNLTDNGETSYDEKPIWSPDGKKVAFVSDYTKAGHGQKNVFVMEPGAADQGINLATQITEYSSGSKVISELAWSPDGSRIAYQRGNNVNDDEVAVVNADGTTTFPLTIGSPGDDKHPTWSADSSKIAYSSGNQVYVASSTGGLGTALANGAGREPQWSPDGTKIAYDLPTGLSDYVDLRIVNADGGSPVTVVDPFPYSEWTFAAWSPDSGRVAYRGHGEGEDYDVRVVNANGGGDHALPGSTAETVYAPSWSPDGSRVVYEAYRWTPTTSNNLYVANADGSGAEVPLTTNGKSYEPVWRVIGTAPQEPPPNPGSKKPKVVWITKRIPWTGGPVHMLTVGCDAPSCSTSTTGKMKGGMAAGILRPAPVSASGKPKSGKRPKWIVVGQGKAKLKEGQTRKLSLTINKTGAAILEKLGKATIQVTVTIKVTGRKKPYRFSHAIHLYVKKSGKKH
jgi:Tol biopolymer transport system component